MTQTSPDYLRELLSKYEQITNDLNTAITTASEYNNKLAIAKSEVSKLKNSKDLIEEQIRCEKQLIQASK